MLLSKAIM